MVKARKYVVKKYFEGVPKRDDFEIVEFVLPALKDGEILVKVEWISLDPYQRAYNRQYQLPYDQFGYQIGIVQESMDNNFPIGVRVVSHKGWFDYCIINPSIPDATGNKPYILPDLKGLPNSLGVGAGGMHGATAYFGFLEICKPKPGETVVVTGAAGAVGSLVGQIAKIKGCKVIGFTGSDEKVEWLEKEIGFDKAFNYKTVNVPTALKQIAPKGVDCYFDNVGGEISSQIISQMNLFGRISACGSISAYNDNPTKLPKATIIQPSIVMKQLKIEGFIVWRWGDRWPAAISEIVDWIKSGQLKAKEHITEGFDNLYEALIGVMAGENIGKAVLKV